MSVTIHVDSYSVSKGRMIELTLDISAEDLFEQICDEINSNTMLYRIKKEDAVSYFDIKEQE